MMKRRRFTGDFNRSAVEQLLSEIVSPTELCRRYIIAFGQLYTKDQYAAGKMDSEPSLVAKLEALVRELESLLGNVTLENEFLKKPVRNSLKQAEKK